MEISKLQDAYGRHPLVRRLTQVLQRDAVRRICVSGLQGSAAPLLFSSLAARSPQLLGVPFLFVLSDEEEAAYFYQDLMQMPMCSSSRLGSSVLSSMVSAMRPAWSCAPKC